MGIAQALYQNGHISYMRTDSVNIANEALDKVRGYIKKQYGPDYLPETPNKFKADKDLDVEGINEAGDFMMFNRAWYWISECNVRKKIWKEALTRNATPELLKCIKITIKYFEEIEEYEKCSLLIKIQVFVEKEIFKASLKDA